MFTGRRRRSGPLYGVMLHTTGSGLPSKAGWDGDRALADGVRLYTNTGGPHYVIGWDGTIVATVADEMIKGAHAGITDATARSAYAANNWTGRVSAEGARLWLERWAPAQSPADLIPGRDLHSINDRWIGIEMIPISAGGTPYAVPAYPGSRFTAAQHTAARKLAHDIARRHNFPSGWADKQSPRLVGHADLNPIQRDSAALPLWDPGYLAKPGTVPPFDMDRVRGSSWLLWAGLAIGGGFLLARYLRGRGRSRGAS
jgi:hypothetical protein